MDHLSWPVIVLVVVGFTGFAFLKGYLANSSAKLHSRAVDARTHSAAWASVKDVPELVSHRPDPTRVRLGRLRKTVLANPPRRSVRVVAPTGAGKTPIYVVPTVLRHHGPAVVASVKFDVVALTQAHRAAQGPVWVFDPSQTGPFPTCRWTPLATIQSWGDAMKAAEWLATSAKAEGRGVEQQEFWDALGRKLLAPLLYLAARTGRQMNDVVDWVEYVAEDRVRQLLAGLRDTQPASSPAYRDAERAVRAWEATASRPEKTKGSVYATAEVVLEAWAHPDIADAVSTTSGAGPMLDIEELLDAGGTLYLVAPAADQRLFAAVFETLVNALVRAVERRAAAAALPLDPPLLLMLDEAANIALLRELDTIASKGAGEGLVLVSVWQDEAQMDQVYGRDKARVIRANHTATVYLPGITDEQTLEHVSASIANHTVLRQSMSHSKDEHTTASVAVVDERLAPVEWVRTRPAGTAIVLVSGHKPIEVQVTGWYQDPALRALVPAEVAARFDKMFAPTPAARRGRPCRPRRSDAASAPPIPPTPGESP